ncbi:MAG: CAP domain-containing protein [Acidimicrobiia bacterium]|nr:CAP domain-containing protein [Acidimicrobiia bacterium]
MAALARRILTTLLTTILLMGALAPAASAATAEGELLALMNAERAANGLAAVSTYADLADDALAWSRHLMSQGSLSHNPNLASVTPSWQKLGENVGVGPNVAALHAAFMASSSHRGNVLGDYDKVGIAVVEESSTKLWVTVVFMKSFGAEPPAEEPVPYSEQGPAPSNEQPVSNNARTTVVAAAPAVAPAVSSPPALPRVERPAWSRYQPTPI